MRERERKEREGESGGNVSGERTEMKGGGWSERGRERGVGVSEGGEGERERPRRTCFCGVELFTFVACVFLFLIRASFDSCEHMPPATPKQQAYIDR